MTPGEIEWLTVLASPSDLIAASHRTLIATLEAELLDRLRRMPPEFFEAVIIDLLQRLGYGGGRPQMGQAIGRAHDGGIDGVIKEDALGLDVVYVQAKRYAEGRTVGRPEVQAFAGSLDGVNASKGILMTTGSFTAGARKYVAGITKRIALIGGSHLARLMVEHRVGVLVSAVYEIKRLDESYFSHARPPAGEAAATIAASPEPPVGVLECLGSNGPSVATPAAGTEPLHWSGLRSRRPAMPRLNPLSQSAGRR